MVAHKAAFDAGEVERLVILVVIILGAEVFIPVAGHILLEKSYTLAVLPEADIDIQTSPVNTDADAVLVPHNTARISVTISLT